MRRNIIYRALPVLLLMTLTACAFGSKMSFDNTPLALPTTTQPIEVAVLDARPYVLTGEKSPSWVGLQRSGFGIPYGVHTKSGTPLATEFAKSISGSFTKNGAPATVTNLPPSAKERSAVVSSLPSSGRSVLLEIRNWRTDTLADVNFDFDLTLSVLKNGKTIATESLSGTEKLDGSMWNPIGASERVAVAKQKEKLDALFASQGIRAALAK